MLAFVCPGHPLLDAVIDLTLERHRDLLRRGAVLVDERDPGTSPRRLLFYLEQTIQGAGLTPGGDRRVVSKRMLYVELDAAGAARHLHYAPYLDYRPLAEGDPDLDAPLNHPQCAWLDGDLESAEQLRLREQAGQNGARRGSMNETSPDTAAIDTDPHEGG